MLYPLLLAVAILDLIPIVGSTIGGIITTLIAVRIGGGVLGIIGAFIAIPVAATIDVLLREFAYPRLDAN